MSARVRFLGWTILLCLSVSGATLLQTFIAWQFRSIALAIVAGLPFLPIAVLSFARLRRASFEATQ